MPPHSKLLQFVLIYIKNLYNKLGLKIRCCRMARHRREKMKKAFLVVSVCALLIACSDDDPQQAAQDMTAHGNYDVSKEHDEAIIINEELADNDQYKIV